MLALTNNAKPGFPESLNCVKVIYAGRLRHGYAGISTSRISTPLKESATAARYSSIATFMFSTAAASVSPCDQQPGNAGHDTLYPSSDFRKAILYFMIPPTVFTSKVTILERKCNARLFHRIVLILPASAMYHT
jgi:hypothetical protein